MHKDGTSKQYSFWADTLEEEKEIWKQLLSKIQEYNNAPVFHYGNYEIKALDNLDKKYGTDSKDLKTRFININSYIYGKIYFPSFSNSLKDIGKCLGYSWTEPDSSGLRSIIWRYQWEKIKEKSLREKLIRYNSEDCCAAKSLLSILDKIYKKHDLPSMKAIEVEKINNDSTYKFGKPNFLIEDFETINKCSYFEYQREKIYFQDRPKKKISRKTNKRVYQYRINRCIEIPTPNICPKCKSLDVCKNGRRHKIVLDIKFFDFGVKRWIMKYSTSRMRCWSCGSSPSAVEFHNINCKYGENLKIWIIYQMISLRQSYTNILKSSKEIFKYNLPFTICQTTKYEMASYYESTYQQILDRLRNGKLIHADETSVSIQGQKAYIAVSGQLRYTDKL